MPHVHVRRFEPLPMPAESDGCRFDFIATNCTYPGERLIAAEVEGKRFFLHVKDIAESTLIKSDKITRPSATYYVQKGLGVYTRLSNSDVLHSNVPDAVKNPHLASDGALKRIEDFAERFPEAEEIRIEVGFGSGRHLLHQAQQHPEILFIGLEIHKPSIEQVLKQINIRKLDNLLLLDYDARLFMEFVPSDRVGRIYVHFPVPWDKKPHRRVISEAFVNEAIRVLKPEGRLELRTDSDNYFQYAWETFTSLQKVRLEIFKNREIAVTSKYEDRWRRMEKNIYDVTMICEETSPPLALEGTFDFPEAPLPAERFRSFNTATERFEGGFLHFERLFAIEGTPQLMYALSMGSFDRPQHLYLISDGDTLRYFPAPPVRSRSNLAAHTRLCELLYG